MELDINGRIIILCLKTPGEINLNVVIVYAPSDPILFSDGSAVINGGYMTNFGVEILAQKIGQSAGCREIKLPQSVEAKISQFSDDTTLICRDVDALKENMKVTSEFNAISGLELNKKTKAVWIGSAKNNKAKPLGFESHHEPVKINRDKNNNLNSFWQNLQDGR